MPDPIESTSAPPAQAETFSREYVKELREESKGWRTKHAEAEAAKVAAEAAAVTAKAAPMCKQTGV